MKVNERKNWKSLDQSFEDWYQSEGCCPSWKKQKNWLSKELVKRNFIKEKQLVEMWSVFHSLTSNCSNWKFQSKILSLITLCFDRDLGEGLETLIK